MKLKLLDSSRITIIIFIIITIIFCLLSLLHIYETFCGGDRIPEYLKHKSSCFSCEKQAIDMYGIDGAWTANSTKGFDDEYEAVQQAGGDIKGGFLAKTIKYY